MQLKPVTKNANIVKLYEGIEIFYSYATPIAINIYGGCKDVLFIDNTYYSRTTSTKHKPAARRILGTGEIIEVSKETFNIIIDAVNAGPAEAQQVRDQIIKDYQQYQEVKQFLTGEKDHFIYLQTGYKYESLHNAKCLNLVKPAGRTPETVRYKNGNARETYFYCLETNYFKLEFKTVQRVIKRKTAPGSKQALISKQPVFYNEYQPKKIYIIWEA